MTYDLQTEAGKRGETRMNNEPNKPIWRPTNIATRQQEANVLKSLPVFPVPSVSSSRPVLYALHGKVQNMLEVHIDNRVLYI